MVPRGWTPLATLVLALTVTLGCGSRELVSRECRDAGQAAPAERSLPASSPSVTRPRIVALGDSVTAGLGLPVNQAYPALIERRLSDEGLNYSVVNADMSGATSVGGLSRFAWVLDGDVRILIVALGGVDGLCGVPPEDLKRNLAQIIERVQAGGITVVLAGMEAPPNFGRDYVVGFHQVYPALVRQYHVAFVPFLLRGVAGESSLNQRDGLHPNARGAEIIADNVWAVLEPIVVDQAGRD